MKTEENTYTGWTDDAPVNLIGSVVQRGDFFKEREEVTLTGWTDVYITFTGWLRRSIEVAVKV